MIDQLHSLLLNEVWCRPEADKNYLLQPSLITTYPGDKGTTSGLRYPFKLPTNDGAFYMVYALGSVRLKNLGITISPNTWVSLETLNTTTDIISYAIASNRVLNANKCFICNMATGGSYLAVETVSSPILASNSELFLKLYTNKWFSDGGLAAATPILKTVKIQNTADIMSLISEAAIFRNAGNFPICFKNGYYIESPSDNNFSVGDEFSILLDESIEGYFDKNLIDAPTFKSSIDSRNRKVITAPKAIRNKRRHYGDNYYFVRGTSDKGLVTERTVGVEFLNVNQYSLRMISPSDVSIDAVELDDVENTNSDIVDEWHKKIRVFYRRNDNEIRLLSDSSFTNLLRQIPETIIDSMMNAALYTPAEWNPENLEAAKYSEFINYRNSDIIDSFNDKAAMCRDVLSYFGLQAAIEGMLVKDGDQFSIQARLIGTSVVTKYDINGMYQTTEQIVGVASSYAYTFDVSTSVAEAIPGRIHVGKDKVNTLFDYASDYVRIEENEVRLVKSTVSDWRLAVEGTDYTVDPADNKVTWDANIISDPNVIGHCRSANDVILIPLTINAEDAGDRIDVISGLGMLDSLDFSGIDVYVNKFKITRDLDFYWDGTGIRLSSYKKIDFNDPTFDIVIRLHGLPSEFDGEYLNSKHSWIKYGQTSRNDAFDFYIGNGIINYINGQIVEESEYQRAEDGFGTPPPWVGDGQTHLAEMRVQHVPEWLTTTVNANRSAAVDFISRAESVMNSRQTQVDHADDEVVISERHPLVSLGIQETIRKIKEDGLVLPRLSSELTVRSLLADIEYLFNYDMSTLREDSGFVDLMPCMVPTKTVTGVEFAFLNKVNEVYLNNRCKLSSKLIIGED